MLKNSLYFSNFTRSGYAFTLYLMSLCEVFRDVGAGHNIQTKSRTMTVIRNPKDVIASSVINNWDNRQDINETILQSQEDYINFYKKILQQEDLIVIDFDDLILKPEKTMESLCELLGLPFNMLERDQNMTFNQNGHLHTSKTNPEYDRIVLMNDKIDYTKPLLKYQKVLKRKMVV